MAIAHLLEDFATGAEPVPTPPQHSEAELEEARLAAYEKGYNAGWDDAVAAQEKERGRISEALAASLEDLNFTFHEAQNQLAASLDPLFRELADAVLPKAMAAAFGHHVADQLMEMARGQADQPMEVVTAPGEGEAVRGLLSGGSMVQVRVQEDAALAPGQAYLRAGGSECEINCGALIDSIEHAISAFTYHVKEDSQYG